MQEFKDTFPVTVVQFEYERLFTKYDCTITVTAIGDTYLSHRKLSIACNDVAALLRVMRTIEMHLPEMDDLVEPKNGFNKRDFLADLRKTLPMGHSKIIGDEYPPNTSDRRALIVTHGFDTNIDILEIEIAETFKARTESLKLPPYDIKVELIPTVNNS